MCIELPKKRILIVEDDVITQIVLTKYLMQEYDLVITSTGEEALVKINKHQFDLIIMDLVLKVDGITGIKTLHLIRKNKNYKNVPVIAQTSYPFLTDREKLYDAGFNEYLLKPFLKNDLMGKIKKFI